MAALNNTNSAETAPVVIFVYKRPEHTRRLLESLSICENAENADIYVYADGAKSERDADAVAAVREVIGEPEWANRFRKFVVSKAQCNKGLARSIIAGVSAIMEIYGKVLVLEDDLVVAPNFLTYMNLLLDTYEADDRIFSITGWTYPLKGLETYKKDAWMYYRACSWGWGTWKNRWDKVVWDPAEAHFEDKLKNPAWCKSFSRGGNDLPGMLRKQLDAEIDSWAIRWNVCACDNGLMTVYPRNPVIMNMGMDGTGANCGKNDTFRQNEFAKAKDSYYLAGIVPEVSLIREAWGIDSDTVVKKIKRNLKIVFVEHRIPDFIMKRFVSK